MATNLVVRVAVAWSNGRESPSTNKRTFRCLSKLLIKLASWIPSIGLEDTIFCSDWPTLIQNYLWTLNNQRKNDWHLRYSPCRKKQSAPSVLESYGIPPLRPQFPISLTWTWKCLTVFEKLFTMDQTWGGKHCPGKSEQLAYLSMSEKSLPISILFFTDFYSDYYLPVLKTLEKLVHWTTVENGGINHTY